MRDRTLKPMHRCKGVGGRHAETGSRGSVYARLTVPPFHPPGKNAAPLMDRPPSRASENNEEVTSAVGSSAKH